MNVQLVRKNLTALNWHEVSEDKLSEVVTALTHNTTKFCPQCASSAMIKYRSMNLKVCADCGQHVEWKLTEGQTKW